MKGNIGAPQFQQLYEIVNEWAKSNGLSLSLLGSEIAGGYVMNMTVIPPEGYGTLYSQLCDAAGYPPEALGAEIVLDQGRQVRVVGLDPVGEVPLLIVSSGDSCFHLSKEAFFSAWESAASS